MEVTKSREVHTCRTFKAPIELMWKLWTSPEHLINWWGPLGFSNTIDQMDVREGGIWKMTMRGPDGTNYPNRSIFREIILHKKIVFEHFNPHFITTVLFHVKGEETEIDWTLLFDTEDLRETIVKVHKADEGQKQNLDKLEIYLSALSSSGD